MSDRWPTVQLKDVCQFENGDRGKNYPGRKAVVESGVPFINAGHLTTDGIDIENMDFIPRKRFDLLNSGKVRQGDLLFCLRGSLGKFAVVETLNEGAIASSLVIVRPTEKIDRRFLAAYFGSSLCQHMIEKFKNGVAQPNLSVKSLKQFEIPLPPLAEQQRIAAILDKADVLRAKRRAALAKLDTLLQATFLDMFGDPVTNPKGWPLQQFGNVGTLERGKSKHRPRNAPELLGGTHPLVQTGDVSNAEGGYLTTYTQTYSDLGLQQSRKWKAGVLCITIAANIANTAILTFDACFPDSVVGFLPNNLVRTEYVQYWLSFLQKNIEENAPQVAQKNINLKILRELEIPIPPTNLQDDFVEVVNKQVHLRNLHEQQTDKTNTFFQSLQQRAFNGDLTFNWG